jgi:hypothetical protein
MRTIPVEFLLAFVVDKVVRQRRGGGIRYGAGREDDADACPPPDSPPCYQYLDL